MKHILVHILSNNSLRLRGWVDHDILYVLIRHQSVSVAARSLSSVYIFFASVDRDYLAARLARPAIVIIVSKIDCLRVGALLAVVVVLGFLLASNDLQFLVSWASTDAGCLPDS